MKILSLSTDPELSLYRKRVLEDAGHEVVALNSEREALEQVEAGDKFDVVLICHRLPDATARKVVRLVREGRPQTRIVCGPYLRGMAGGRGRPLRGRRRRPGCATARRPRSARAACAVKQKPKMGVRPMWAQPAQKSLPRC